MKQTLEILSWAQSIGFAIVAAATIADWVRRRDRERGWLALAVGLLGALAVVGRIEQVTGKYPSVVTELTIPAFLASGYALALFRHTVMPAPRRVLGVLFALLVGVSASSFLVTLPNGVNPTLTGEQWVLIWAMMVLWAGCVVEPAARFWLASKGRPSLQRARLRALSAGYGGIVVLLFLALVIGAVVGPHLYLNDTYRLCVAIAGTAAIPLLYIGFAPPRMLRRVWSGREEMALRRAFGDLLLGTDPALLAELGLDWSLRLVGGECGLLAGRGGRVLASRGLDPAMAASLAAVEPGSSARLTRVAAEGRAVLVAPMPLHEGTGMVAVVPGPFTPSLGGDEVSRLGTFAVALASALERTRLADALARQTARQESILGAMSDLGEGFVVVDDQRVVFANEAFCALTGRTQEELAALASFVDVVALEDRQEVARRIEHGVANEDLAAFLETALVAPDGRRIEVEMAGKGVEAGGQYIAICRDVSERRRSHEELERSNADLQAFASVASHDLQEPLRMVASYLQLLDRRYHGHLDADAHEFLSYAVDGATRMQALINDLLAYSRAGAEVPMRPTDCSAVVSTALANLRRAVADADARVVVEPLPAVIGDAAQLVQVFQNLVSNALKFRGDRKPVVNVSGEVYGGVCTLAVRDNGIGIEERHLDHVFMIFKRLHSHDQYAGTGIGLSICKRIVERQGGRIWVESTPGKGSVFRIALPAAAQPAAAKPVREAVPA